MISGFECNTWGSFLPMAWREDLSNFRTDPLAPRRAKLSPFFMGEYNFRQWEANIVEWLCCQKMFFFLFFLKSLLLLMFIIKLIYFIFVFFLLLGFQISVLTYNLGHVGDQSLGVNWIWCFPNGIFFIWKGNSKNKVKIHSMSNFLIIKLYFPFRSYIS